ncbi:MAG TPA: phosphoglycerate mutase family protein [Thermoanaerobaculia bacterium]|jgi:broad specificity phosphatase PhoE|nr:phosphoglycerate mutase family protein [Thermoanaerobaculia bacterium]
MTHRSIRVLATLAALALTSSLALAQTVFVVRHAEKISESDQRLTDAGHERARRLAKLLGSAGIRSIYATDTERAKDTAKPLSDALKIPITTYDVGKGMAKGAPDATEFASSLRKDHPNDAVLVVGHSNTLPEILKALGVKDEISIAANQYDDVFVVVPGASGAPTLVRLKY